MTAVNLNRAIRGPVTAVPVVAGKGVRIVPDTVNNRFVVEADETVLWEGSKTSPTGDTKLSLSITFSESVANFEYLKIFYWYRTANNAAWKVDMCYVDEGSFHFTCQWPESATGNWFMYRLYGSGTTASGDGGYKAAASVNTFGSYGGGMWEDGTIWKVVGCNRIAST